MIGAMRGIDYWFPPAGPCAICGGPDKRHRLWDAMLVQLAFESESIVARDYGLTVGAVHAVRVISRLAVKLEGMQHEPVSD